jgi:hypothetical protein
MGVHFEDRLDGWAKLGRFRPVKLREIVALPSAPPPDRFPERAAFERCWVERGSRPRSRRAPVPTGDPTSAATPIAAIPQTVTRITGFRKVVRPMLAPRATRLAMGNRVLNVTVQRVPGLHAGDLLQHTTDH